MIKFYFRNELLTFILHFIKASCYYTFELKYIIIIFRKHISDIGEEDNWSEKKNLIVLIKILNNNKKNK